MRTLLLLIAAFLVFGGVVDTNAQTEETVRITLGQRKTADRGRITIVFRSVLEDSRCPMNARCVWAGNAKIRISVSKGRSRPQIIELNSGTEPRVVSAFGYEFELVDLRPQKGDPRPIRKQTAIVSVKKSGR